MIENILLIFTVALTLFLTEFIVNCMLFILFSSIYPLQKFKTIRKKYRKRILRDRILLTYLFQYGINFKTVFTFALCWIHRISGLTLAFTLIVSFFNSAPYPELIYWIWRGVQLIVAIICLLKLRNRTL